MIAEQERTMETTRTRIVLTTLCALLLGACSSCSSNPEASNPAGPGGGPGSTSSSASSSSSSSGGGATGAHLPLVLVGDVPLPGKANRFDYQDIDKAQGHLIIAHMNDSSVVIANLADGSVAKVLPGIPTPRGIIAGPEAGRIFVTSTPGKLVIIDNKSLNEIARVTAGAAPDGVGWDPVHQMVATSDQSEGAMSIIASAGSGARTQVPLGQETGNVVFDAGRKWFWITVNTSSPPDQLMAVDPVTAKKQASIGLPGCSGAHGLRIHPDGKSAFIACEGNDSFARVDLDGAHGIAVKPVGSGPDVLALDPGLGWIYVSAESGDLRVFDMNQPGLVQIDAEHPGDHSHTVAVDPDTHRVFFPLQSGPNGTPVLRIMKPSGM